MARSNLTDFLQDTSFWLFDTASIEAIGLPVLNPLMGFSAISAPEMIAEVNSFYEGNWFYKRKVINRADVGNITLTRGARFYDSDFWRWIISAVHGNTTVSTTGLLGLGNLAANAISSGAGDLSVGGPSPRRNLVLIQFFTHITAKPAPGTVVSKIGSVLTELGLGPFDIAAKIPARAWVLTGCLPIRYKAGGGFDAGSSAVSLMTLEMAVEQFEELSLSL